MSTTIKRVALVAVAALGLGVMSVAPSTATTNADTLTLSASTAAQLTGETATATSAVATLTYLSDTLADSMTVTVSLVSAPATSVTLPKLLLMETSSAQVKSPLFSSANEAIGSTTGIPANTPAFVVPSGATSTNLPTAKFRVYLDAPTVAGAYVVRVTPAVSGVGVLNAAAQTLTITVTAAPADNKVAATATSIISAGETNSATADVTVTSTRTQNATPSATTAAATIKVGLLNSSGLAANESFTATIAGPGILGAYTPIGSDVTLDEGSPSARVLMVKNGDVVQVYPDGASGVATITISSLLGVVLATETVTFFGAATTITATVKKPVLGGTTDTTGVLEVTVKDSAGVSVSDLANKIGVVSSDITKIATNYTPTSTYSAKTGTYLVNVRPVAAGSSNLTVTTKASATATTGIDAAAAVAVRVGGGKDKLDGLTVATDKTSYAPGELVTLTVTPLDAAGLVLGDETHTVFTSTGILSSHSVTSPEGTSFSLGQASAQDGGLAGTGTKLGVATYKFYAPNIEGDMTLSWTRSTEFVTAANDSLTGKITIAVSSPGTAAATDAANEATDAANAATDAALAAAEAADAATTAAQEASDAVAALSESVTKLIAGLQSQIKSLAAVVAKIAKKVKA